MINIKESFEIFCLELKYFKIESSPEIFRSLKYDNIRDYTIIEKIIKEILEKVFKINIDGNLINGIIEKFNITKNLKNMKKTNFYFIILSYILYDLNFFEILENEILRNNESKYLKLEKSEKTEENIYDDKNEERLNLLKNIHYYLKQIKVLERNKKRKLKKLGVLLNQETDDHFEYLDFGGDLEESFDKNILRLKIISKIHQNPSYKKNILLWFSDSLNKVFFVNSEIEVFNNSYFFEKQKWIVFSSFYFRSQKVIKRFLKFFLAQDNDQINLNEKDIKNSVVFQILNKVEKGEDVFYQDLLFFENRISLVSFFLQNALYENLKNQLCEEIRKKGFSQIKFFSY